MVLSALFIIFADVMRIDIITVLPEMLEGFFNESILARAQKKGLAEIHLHNLRDYTLDKWKRVDDYPYGGSAGMVMQCEPIDRCIAALKAEREYDDVIYVSPDGETFNQKIANEMSMQGNLIILCGHYKGIDQRVRDHLITREISVGDYVLTGGELAAAIISDAVIRLFPGRHSCRPYLHPSCRLQGMEGSGDSAQWQRSQDSPVGIRPGHGKNQAPAP